MFRGWSDGIASSWRMAVSARPWPRLVQVSLGGELPTPVVSESGWTMDLDELKTLAATRETERPGRPRWFRCVLADESPPRNGHRLRLGVGRFRWPLPLPLIFTDQADLVIGVIE